MRALGRIVETDLGELAAIAWSQRRWLIGLSLGAGLLGLLLSFLITPRYHSVVSVLPSKGFLRDQQIVFARSSIEEAVELRPTTASNSQNLVTAASYKVRAALVDSLDLVAFFGHAKLAASDPEPARQRAVDDLRRATHLELSIYRDVLFIHVNTRDPQMSARIANLYVTLIEAENLALYRHRALAMQVYLEQELLRLRGDLFAVADSLAGFYRKYGLLELDSERDQLFSLLGELQHQRSALALSLAREGLDREPADPQLARLRGLLGVYDGLVAELSPGSARTPGGRFGGLLEPRVGLGAEALQQRLRQLQAAERDLRIDLAATIMETSREDASLAVMDRAVPASEPFWPRRWLLTLGAAILVPGLVYLGLLYRSAIRRLAAAEGL